MKLYTRPLFLPVLLLLLVQCDSPTGPTPEPGGEEEAAAPRVPANLRAAAVRAGEIELTWTDQSLNETEFRAEARGADESYWSTVLTAAANTTNLRHTGLRAGNSYVYRLRACNQAGCSAYSSEASATATSPAPPTDLAAAAVVSGRIELAWKDNSTDEASFELEYRDAADASWYPLTRTAPNTTSIAHTELRARRSYAYRVRACSDAGCSPYSAESGATVTGPVMPTELRVEPSGSGRVELRWRDNSGDEMEFRIEYRGGTDLVWYTLASTPTNMPSYSHTGLKAGTVYAYRVSSCNASGCSDPSEAAQATVAGPVAPSDMAAVPVRSGRVNLSWKDNSTDEALFRIEYREAPGVAWYDLEAMPANVTAVAHVRLRAGTTYTYRVRACNDAGCSAAADEVQATVLGPAAPSNLSAAAAGSGRIVLGWQDNSDDEAMTQLQVRAASSMSWSVQEELPPNARGYVHANLRAGDSYVYRARTCNASGCSEYSNEVRATVAGPAAPSALAATGRVDGIALSWRDNSGDEEHFEVQQRFASSTAWSSLAQTAAGATSYLHGGVRAGDTHVYRVRSCNASGCSAFSGEATATVSTGPSGPVAPPVLISPGAGTQGVERTPSFSWMAVSSATSYRLMVAPAAAPLPSDPEQSACAGCVINTTATGTSFASTLRLSASTTYRWQVKALTPSGSTAWSEVRTFSTGTGLIPFACPSRWTVEDAARGVLLCKQPRVLSNGETADQFVVMVNLKMGAKVVSRAQRAPGQEGVAAPLFVRRSVHDWYDASSALGTRFCAVTGAQFMAPPGETRLWPWNGDPTQLSFPLRQGGELLTIAGETEEHYDRSVLFIHNDHAEIQDYKLSRTADAVAVGAALSGPSTAVVARRPILFDTSVDAQSYAAVRDGDDDGRAETMMFYFTTRISHSELTSVLTTDFKVAQIFEGAIQLDGGNSAQVRCESGLDERNRDSPVTTRGVPHAFVILQGP